MDVIAPPALAPLERIKAMRIPIGVSHAHRGLHEIRLYHEEIAALTATLLEQTLGDVIYPQDEARD